MSKTTSLEDVKKEEAKTGASYIERAETIAANALALREEIEANPAQTADGASLYQKALSTLAQAGNRHQSIAARRAARRAAREA